MAVVTDSTTIYPRDFRVGQWWARPTLGRLERGEEELSVESKSMAVLVDLAEHAGDVRSKRRLLHVVWGDAFVSDDVLTHAVWELRKVFSDNARNPEYIETIPRKGYRLIAPVTSATDPVADLGSGSFHYKTLGRLGGGAMGVVHKAEDTKLKRIVALKFLPPELSEDGIAKERFLREARAAARLDHVNVATVYDIGEDPEGLMFIAMAFYDGETVKKKIEWARQHQIPISIPKCLDLAEQIARGLAAAHAEGIVHRDIKPANVMVTKDDQTKIVDFGLAKLANAATLTHAGQIAGTVAYMSPEQLLNKEIDSRTDLWSLGVVLYEMVAGRRPFGGESDGSAVQAILNEGPQPLFDTRPDCPQVVSNIVEALLRKDPDARMGDAAEVADRLADAKLSSDLTATMPVRQEHVPLNAPDRPRPTDGRSTSPANWLLPRFLRNRIRSPWALLSGTLAIVLASWFFIDQPRNRDAGPFQVTRSRQISELPGWEADAAISPDGSLVAYASNESGNADIWLAYAGAGGGEPIPLTEDPARDSSPAWFPDGSAIAFASERGGDSGIWRMPRFPGRSVKLIDKAADPAISPDGSKIAFAKLLKNRSMRIAVSDLREPTQEILLTHVDDGAWNHRDPAWSPDGELICYSNTYDLWLVPSAGGDAKPLTSDAAGDAEPTWSRDGKYIFFSSYRQGTLALWRIPSSGGTPERVTPGTGPERHPSLSLDGSRIAYTTHTEDRDIFLVDLGTQDQLRVPGNRSEWGASFPDDGSFLVFVSNQLGGSSLWKQPLDGGQPSQETVRLTQEEAYPSNPSVSPDGKWVAYQRRSGAEREIWIVSAAGGVPSRFFDGPGLEIHPSWSPSGTEIAFVSSNNDEYELLVAAVDGTQAGSLRSVATGVASVMWPDWSADGREIAYVGSEGGTWEIWVARTDGAGSPRKITTGAMPEHVKWHRQRGTLLVSGFWGSNVLALKEVDPATGAVESFEPEVNFGPGAEGGDFAIDSGARLLAFTHQVMKGDVWLLETGSRGG